MENLELDVIQNKIKDAENAVQLLKQQEEEMIIKNLKEYFYIKFFKTCEELEINVIPIMSLHDYLDKSVDYGSFIGVIHNQNQTYLFGLLRDYKTGIKCNVLEIDEYDEADGVIYYRNIFDTLTTFKEKYLNNN